MIEYKTVSLANQVFERLEHNILSGQYAIGEIISENRLSQDLGVSRTPIREAMSRLMEEGLVAESPNGTVVLGITEDDVDDLYDIKRKIEPTVAGLAAGRQDPQCIETMEEILQQQEFFAGKGDIEKLRDLDTGFHDALYECCGRRIFQNLLSSVHHKIMKFRKASLEADPGRALESVEEHREILRLLKEGACDEIRDVMAGHIENGYKGALKELDKNKDAK